MQEWTSTEDVAGVDLAEVDNDRENDVRSLCVCAHVPQDACSVLCSVPEDQIPDFAQTSAMADFEEASVSAFQDVFGDINVAGYWFHYAQSIVKRWQGNVDGNMK